MKESGRPFPYILPLISTIIALCLMMPEPDVLAQSQKYDKDRTAEEANPPIYIAFQWHMHQPIYFPGETLTETDRAGHYSYSIKKIHTDRTGPYTNWPADAVQKGIDANLGHLGAQVSFSGTLIDNLNNLKKQQSTFVNWREPWQQIISKQTELGNPRVDMVGFGYYHPLMPLIPDQDIRKQIQLHKRIMGETFTGEYSKGIFPPENAFSTRIIPPLVKEGFDWVLVDNIHFERAAKNYPHNTGSAIYEPNRSEARNPDPGDWIQLNNVWAPTKVSAQWAHQPHYVQHIDSETGEAYKMIAVPTSQYLGNEDGRGGFGALNYESVMSQFEAYNTDPDHPILIVLHHDGDNHGGGSSAYYGTNFANFVNWIKAHPDRFVATTVQDYLEQFPPDPTDIIHVEPGSWVGADGGDPEFKKWNADADPSTGYSPDRNSWAVLTAARNWVKMADALTSASNNQSVEDAWNFLLNAEGSDYWYWDRSQGGIWDTHPTRAANLAIKEIKNMVEQKVEQDNTAPELFFPQREPYNPGALEWGEQQPSSTKIWSYVYDVNELQRVELRYRADKDGEIRIDDRDNHLYNGGNGVEDWQTKTMNPVEIPPETNEAPLVKADRFEAEVSDLSNLLIDYYIEAEDSYGNVSRSSIRHVWVGSNGNSGSGDGNGNGDNNDGSNLFTLDGELDTNAELVSKQENGGQELFALRKDNMLYVSAPSAALTGTDQFIILTDDPEKSLTNAPWAKEGSVAQWDLFLANEADNNWSGWFDAEEGQPDVNFLGQTAGTVLEGTVDLPGLYGDTIPDTLYLALLSYQTTDGGGLVNQLPDGNGDNEITGDELLVYSPQTTVTDINTEQSNRSMPVRIELLGNYPNPFNPETTIQFRLQEASRIKVDIYNIAGRHIETLFNGRKSAGMQRLVWNAVNVSSGMYLYQIRVDEIISKTGSMVLLK